MSIRRAVAMFAVLTVFGVGAMQSAQAVDTSDEGATTFTTSTRHLVTTERIDLPEADATECGASASPPTLVEQTTVALTPVDETFLTFGPDTIFIGEDEQTPYTLADGETNFNTRTTYETVVTQYFQGVAEGPPCAVAVEARFTG
jgi:hypothetical protein